MNTFQSKIDISIGTEEEINEYLSFIVGNYSDNYFTPEGFFKLFKWLKEQEIYEDYKLFGKYIHEDYIDYVLFPRNTACFFLRKDGCRNCLEGIEKRTERGKTQEVRKK